MYKEKENKIKHFMRHEKVVMLRSGARIQEERLRTGTSKQQAESQRDSQWY